VKKQSIVLLLCALLTLGPACNITKIKRGRPLDPARAAKVRLGDSRAEVLALLGPPHYTSRVQGGTRFHYTFRDEADSDLRGAPP